MERAGLQCPDQHPVRRHSRLVRYLQEVRQAAGIRAERSLLWRLGGSGPARSGQRLAAGDRRCHRQGALAQSVANAAGCWRYRDIGRRAVHGRPKQRLPGHRRARRQDTLPVQHRGFCRRRRHQLRARRQAVCGDHLRRRFGILRRLRHLGGDHFRPPMTARRLSMDPSVITALAGLTGAAVGGLTSGLASWLIQKTQVRTQWLAQEKLLRQELYNEFIEEASKCYIDALQHDNPDVAALVGLYAKVARMRVLSSQTVLEHAEQVERTILDAYLEPDKTFPELQKMAKSGSIDLLRNFSEACRAEFESLRAQ